MSSSIVYGVHAVARRLQQAPELCIELICADKRNPRLLQLIDQARNAGIEVRTEPRARLTQLSGSDKHQGCLLKTRDSEPVMDFSNVCLV